MDSFVSVQPDLFATGSARLDRTFGRAHRVQLDQTSWVEHVPGWLAGSDGLFAHLLATAAWEQRTRWTFDRRVTEPRLTAEYADVSDLSAPILGAVVEAVSRRYETTYQRLWINLYRDHRDSTSWHGDPIGRRGPDSVVPVLSLGATRRFLIKPTTGGASVRLTVAAGDLVVMGGRTQRDWQHCVPKQVAPTGPRISVNFAPHEPDRTSRS